VAGRLAVSQEGLSPMELVKPQVKRPLRRQIPRSEDNIKMDGLIKVYDSGLFFIIKLWWT
jgi:hypothetical protein